WDPLQKLLTKLVTDCARAGLVRKDLTPGQISALLSSTLTALAQIGVFQVNVKTVKLNENQMWAWCRQAVGPTGDATPKKTAKPPRTAGATTGRAKKLTG